ncbi:MAG: HEAT repeat domain-containing protein [Elusimicrobia bacterium]|nr:HEAT repeat domain-containing protein [Elusimicrobiota bacterium]
MTSAVLAALLLAAPAPAAEGAKPSAAVLFKQGMDAKMHGDYTAALAAFTKAMQEYERLPGAHLARGLTYLDAMMAQGRYEHYLNAEKDLVIAVDEAPRNPLALSGLGLVRALNGDRRGEVNIARASAVRDTLPAYGYAAQGRFHLEDSEWKDAVIAYRKAFLTSPQDHPLREFIRREMLVVRDRVRIRRDPVEAPKAEKVEFEPDPYLEALASADPEERAAAAKELGRPGLDAAIEPLSALLKDPELEVRATCLQSLGLIGEPKAVSAILPFLGEKSKYMRALAVRALGNIGSERARKPLNELIKAEKEALVLADAKKAVNEIDNAAYTMKMDMDLLMEELSAGK